MMNSPNIDRYVVGIFANSKGVGITLIGTNKEIDTFWVFDHIYQDKATICGIKDTLDSLFNRFPQIRNIHINNIENLRRELNSSYKNQLYINKNDIAKDGFIYVEKRSEVKIIDFEAENLAFVLNSYINDGRLIFNDSLLEKKSNLKSEIEDYKLNVVNQSVFSLYIAISEIEPIETRFLCGTVRRD